MILPRRKDCLSQAFYARCTKQVARDLIGKALVHKVGRVWIGGLIVETEAYLADRDLASHSARGQTKSNESMFSSPGMLYVYPIHAKYCMNAVTERDGMGAAVLIRAIEPLWGVDQMRVHRNKVDIRQLTRGPAMLCQALQVDRTHDGQTLLGNTSFRIAVMPVEQPFRIDASRRIGISKSKDRLLRFTMRGSRFLSR
jgi:DNA-3-methyladenine glycosylase